MTSVAGPSSLDAAPSYAGAWSTLKPRLHPSLEEHVTSTLGFPQMTPVQASVIPLFLSYKDVIVEAVTGSGKTMAYVLPVLEMLHRRNRDPDARLKPNQVGALVICPTRELAIQVHTVIHDVLTAIHQGSEESQADKIAVSGALAAVGGSTSSPANDYQMFRNQSSDIIVGTPGRVEELLKRPGMDLKELEVLILDEADRLLDMGFQHSLTTVLNMLPKQRRTGLFSATMTDALGELVRVGLRNPVRVVVKVETKTTKANGTGSTAADKRMPATLENLYTVCRPEHKVTQLLRLLQYEVRRKTDDQPTRKAIVYFATCAQVNYFFKVLTCLRQATGLQLYSLHGKQTPARRRATYDAFVSSVPLGHSSKTEMASILLCTDVAARGLDLPSVDLVVQFDPPTDPKVFSHRCGRTARAGRRGRAVVMLQEGREEDYVDFLRVRKNPVKQYPYLVEDEKGEPYPGSEEANVDSGSAQLYQDIKEQIRKDRALHELSLQAFVSFVQGYRKHEVSFVFRERELNLDALAYTFGLLRLPSMPEVKHWRKAKESSNVARELFVEEPVDVSVAVRHSSPLTFHADEDVCIRRQAPRKTATGRFCTPSKEHRRRAQEIQAKAARGVE